MSGSFGSINTALTALRYQQVALDVASTNVANVGTDGYVRRRVVAETLGSGTTPALWSRSNDASNGVQASRVDRMTDALLDSRVRREHGRQTYLDLRADVLARIETGLAEPGASGVAAALVDFRKTLSDAGNAPGSDAARSQVLEAAARVADAINLQSAHLADEASDQRSHAMTAVDEANVVATELAATNQTIAAAKAGGSDTSTLMDERDALALRLTELTGATATVADNGTMSVELDGRSLVNGRTASKLTITGGIGADGSATTGPVTFGLDPDPGVPVSLGGDLGATVELLDHDIPSYAAGLDAVAHDLADHVNAVQTTGYDAGGNLATGKPLFGFVAGRMTVAITDPSDLAVSSVAGDGTTGNRDGNNAAAMARAVDVDGDYQRLVNGFGSKVASAQQLAKNQLALTNQVDSAREQLTGVSLDEETVNMLAAQRAYEAAARVMTTIDSVLDTLINRTGAR